MNLKRSELVNAVATVIANRYPNRLGSLNKVVEHQIKNLEDFLDGKKPVYTSAEDFMYDFYPDFSWDPEAGVAETQALMRHRKFKSIAQRFRQWHKFDLAKDLQQSIDEAK